MRRPVNKAEYQDVKGMNVLVGTYDMAIKMMSDISFLPSLVNFPKEQINDETVELLQPYFAAADFNYEAAYKAARSVAGLCNWSASMCTYHEVAKVVEPKIAKLREAEVSGGCMLVSTASAAAAWALLLLVATAWPSQSVCRSVSCVCG